MYAAVFVLLGCPQPISADYEAARSTALKRPGPAGSDWAPDAILHLSHDMLGTLITKVLVHYGTLEDDINARVATLHPALTVKGVTLGIGECEECLSVRSNLEGTLGVDTAVGDTTVPLTVNALFDAKVSVDKTSAGWLLQLEPRGLKDLDVQLSGVGLGYAKTTVQQWIDSNLLAELPPQEITTLGGDDWPLRAVKVVPREASLQVHLLSRIAQGQPVPIVDATPEGWRLDVSPETLVGLAAAQAYEAGPQARDVIAIPTTLRLKEDAFALGLRLWRLSGRGWWRDYEVTGRVNIEGGKFAFKPEDAKRLKSSKGAAFADPLAALGQGVILRALEDALETTLPATHREDADGLRTRVAAKSITGDATRVIAEGRLIVRPVPERGTRKGKRRKRRGKGKAKSKNR